MHRPTVLSMSKTSSGTIATPARRSASMITIPTMHAMTQGCVTTFRSVALRSEIPLKIAIPRDHMTTLTGIR